MKKRYFLLLIFLLLFTACTEKKNYEDLNSNNEEIIEALDGRTEKEILYGTTNLSDYHDDILYESLARSPEKYQGLFFTNIGVIGQVIETDEETQYLINVDDDPTHIFYAHFLKDNPNYGDIRLLENDEIIFYASSIGLLDYETSGNTTKTVPNIIIHNYFFSDENIGETISFEDYSEYKLGDTVRFETGHEITITNISETDEQPNLSSIINGKYIRVDLTFKNGEENPITLSGPLFRLFNSDGSEAVLDSKNFLYEEIQPNKSINYSIYFDAGESPYRLLAGDSLWVSE